MLNIAFTLLGSPVSWLEVIAFVLALANIVCNVFEIHWGWPLTVVASLLYAGLFYTSKLYGEAGVNVFFAATAFWGWWQWLKGAPDAGHQTLVIRNLPARSLRSLVAAWSILWVACSVLLQSVTDSDVAWADGFVTAGSVVGTYLLGRKFLANWPVWLVVNAASMALFLHKDLTLTVVLYGIFFVLALWGWYGWHRRLHQQTPVRGLT